MRHLSPDRSSDARVTETADITGPWMSHQSSANNVRVEELEGVKFREK